MAATTLEVQRDDVTAARLHEHECSAPGEGAALLEVERFALTANNVTYAVMGDALSYWSFFPAQPPWGRVPAWGVARVVESHAEGLHLDTRVYGYVPMSTHMTVVPERISEHGFSDATAHRAELPAAYNSYELLAAEGREDQRMLLRPLFTLAFLVDDQLTDELGQEATTVILTSASSRTSLAIAYLAAARGTRVVALTSERNRAFVESVGVYHRVLTYAQAGEVDDDPSVLVDVAGAAEPRAAVHRRLGDTLVRSVLVGVTHRPTGGGDVSLPGPTPAFFFAPDRLRQRVGDWGRAGFEQRLEASWSDYLEWCDRWLTVEHRGRSAALETWHEIVEGSATPALGHVVSLASE